MFFSFSLFPPGISARCSRSAFPPGVSARISARHFPPAGLGSRNVSALRLPLGVCPFLPAFLPSGPSPRFRPAFPPGVWVCATACYSRSAFPPGFPSGFHSGGAWLAERFRAPPAFAGLVRFCLPVFCMRLLPHTAKNAPAGIRTLACSAAAPAAGTVLSNRPAAPSAAESAPYGLQSYI